MQTIDDRRTKIRELNDAFRKDPSKGKLMITEDVTAIAYQIGLEALIKAVQADTRFTDANDPHQEHDFGSVQLGSHKVWWKIDYYGLDLETGSEDPTNPSLTTRVMTLMTPSEY